MRSIRSFANDDRHVMVKHSTIYPSPEELEAVQNMVSTVECALKHVSDWLDETNKGTKTEGETEVKKDEAVENYSKDQRGRTLCGVMRIGLVAKGLLIKDDMDLELVLMCKDKPTETLLTTVRDNLPVQIQKLTEEKYQVEQCVNEASIIIRNTKEPTLTLKVILTSPLIRDELEKKDGENVSMKDPPDLLDRQKCLNALASLRHAKWFQARANGLKSCVIVLRILRDLCNRVPTWAPLKGWPLELICEKSIGTCNRPLGAGEALRRVMECLASGILLPGGPGLHDPCERDPTDALSYMTIQQKEDITHSAQHALRLSAFGQIYKVLEMDPLPSSKPFQKYSWSVTDKEGAGSSAIKRPFEDGLGDDKDPNKKMKRNLRKILDSKAIDLMNALMRLNQIRPGLQYKLLSQSGPVHAPVFTMSVDVDGTTYEASGPSKKTAKLHVAVKVLQAMGYPTGFDADIECMSSDEKSDNESKNETVSSNSSNNTGNSTTETSSTLEIIDWMKSNAAQNVLNLILQITGIGVSVPGSLEFSVETVKTHVFNEFDSQEVVYFNVWIGLFLEKRRMAILVNFLLDLGSVIGVVRYEIMAIVEIRKCQAKGVVNTAVSAAVQAVRGRGRGTLTRGAFVGATAAPGYIAPGYGTPYGYSTAAPAYGLPKRMVLLPVMKFPTYPVPHYSFF
ncbi:PREDICTED: spermatid perinuclear RNA-binding protein [Dipodomys ordii]|uniref:Spermatid perinuclear RNA-binding protein n=1 Tax=Dipodomys ordii TaxID=10020 RepID=A0A1S3FJD5_DIPOR|nr:PREDICTED: spermatid perinuclear RNA-binding protein [Dipodomys ordii]